VESAPRIPGIRPPVPSPAPDDAVAGDRDQVSDRTISKWREHVKPFVSPVLVCLIAGGVQGSAADVSRIELLPLQTVTVTEEQFLTASRDGRPVTIAVELRLPATAAARVPAVVLLHGSGGAKTRDDRCPGDLYEQSVGRVLNRETGLPLTRNDECLKGGGPPGYDARAHANAVEDVKALLQRVFKLEPAR